MKFVLTADGHMNPKQVDLITVEKSEYAILWDDERGEERYMQYSFYAVLASGRRVLLELANDRKGPVDAPAIMDHWLNKIEEAME